MVSHLLKYNMCLIDTVLTFVCVCVCVCVLGFLVLVDLFVFCFCFCFFKTGSLCISGCPRTQTFALLCLQSAAIKGVRHHHLADSK